jgi:hypothetical protein
VNLDRAKLADDFFRFIPLPSHVLDLS